MYKPLPIVIDEQLLKFYRLFECALCGGSWEVSGHHIMKRSKHRLDKPYNLVPLCAVCHSNIELAQSQFVSYCKRENIVNEEEANYYYKRFTDWRPIMNIYRREINYGEWKS